MPQTTGARMRYEASLAAVVCAEPTVPVTLLDDLAVKAEDYYHTLGGPERLLDDITLAEQAHHWEQAAVLRTARERGRLRYSAGIEIREILTASSSAAGSTPTGMRTWLPDQPIWPNKRTAHDALRRTTLTPTLTAEGVRAFRALFSRAWEKLFLDPRTRTIRGPASDKEGWEWRERATLQATGEITNASGVALSDLASGQVVFNGYGVRAVAASMLGLEEMQLVGPNGNLRRVHSRHVTYRGGGQDGPLPEDTVWVRLPNLETGQGTG
jgi:hypothetical protein